MSKKKILIVDDDTSFAEYAKTILEEAGYETSVCFDGRSAVKAVKAENPDIVLTDIGLPDITGIEVIRLLKEEPKTRSIPILVCSITHNEDEIRRAIQSGGEGFLAKPLKILEVCERIKTALASGGKS